MQGQALLSLPIYALLSSILVVVAPTATHSGTGLTCDKDTHQRRLWCRVELSRITSAAETQEGSAQDHAARRLHFAQAEVQRGACLSSTLRFKLPTMQPLIPLICYGPRQQVLHLDLDKVHSPRSVQRLRFKLLRMQLLIS